MMVFPARSDESNVNVSSTVPLGSVAVNVFSAVTFSPFASKSVSPVSW